MNRSIPTRAAAWLPPLALTAPLAADTLTVDNVSDADSADGFELGHALRGSAARPSGSSPGVGRRRGAFQATRTIRARIAAAPSSGDRTEGGSMSRFPVRGALAAALASLAFTLAGAPLAAAKPKAAPTDDKPAVDPALLSTIEWREVGPYRGGRADAVTGLAGDRVTYYFGSSGGGVWKTSDAGRSWKSVSDGFFGGSIGAVAVAPSDHNVVYVGTGEETVRGNVSEGDGMWKSTDAGKSWTHVGLTDSRHITRVRVHPQNPDLVYACALGHLFGPNDERGVFRSRDGGTTWDKIKFVSRDAGCVDLAMDPTNPRVLYASFWNIRRQPWTFESGGAGSGIWKSTDGGDNWSELTTAPGLPRGTIGISGVSVSPSNPDNVWAIVEAEDGGVFRSRDAGKTWNRVNDDRSLRQRAWYYSRIYADPKDEETVYVVNVRFQRSKDGGKSFEAIRTPHGDNHDLWIDPDDPRRMIESNDGGAQVSEDGGESWTTQANQPTAQIYRVSTDNDFPWRILGAQQDNSALRIRSRSAVGSSIGEDDWEETAGGESGYIVAKPDEPDVVYGGSYGGFLMRADHRTMELRLVNVWPDDPMGSGAEGFKYRFQWNFPMFFSPHDPNTLYAAANVLFKTTNGGQSWTQVSPDLTRDDPSKLGPAGGPITKDNTGVEYYCTIFAAAESPLEAGLLWAGSDDGLVHVSRDGGANWTNVTPKGLPEWSQVNAIDPDPFAAGGAYLAATRYKLDDETPYLYKTADYGATWTRIDAGIPRNAFTRAVRADPAKRGVLYAGTQRGIFVSFDDGAHWQSLQGKLPQVAITDLAIKEGTLVAATEGRGFWALDDLEVVRQLAPGDRADADRLFAPRRAYRFGAMGYDFGGPRLAGKNPPNGVLFQYVLTDEPKADAAMKLEILGDGDQVLRTFTRKPKKEGPGSDKPKKDDSGEDLRQLPAEKGGNRFAWDLELAPPEGFDGIILWNRVNSGPQVLPGTYRAKLTVGDWSATVPFEVVQDPRTSATAEDLQKQFEFLVGVRDKLSEMHAEIRKLRDVRSQLETLEKRAGDGEAAKPLVERSKALRDKLTKIEEALYQTKNRSAQDPLNFPIRLNDKLAGVYQVASLGAARPTDQDYIVRDELVGKIDAQLAELRQLEADELPAINDLARDAQLPFVAPTPKKEG